MVKKLNFMPFVSQEVTSMWYSKALFILKLMASIAESNICEIYNYICLLIFSLSLIVFLCNCNYVLSSLQSLTSERIIKIIILTFKNLYILGKKVADMMLTINCNTEVSAQSCSHSNNRHFWSSPIQLILVCII